jgi:glycolate oxidase iron-sulfur subunit
VDDIIAAARALSAQSSPNSLHRILYRSLFARLNTLGNLPGFAFLLSRFMSRECGLAVKKPARSFIPVITRPENRKPGMRVGYFLGCAANYLLPDIAKSVVAVLKHSGCEVFAPLSYCCGLPLTAAGEVRTAAKLLDANRRLFSELKLDAVVTDCSSCSFYLTSNGFFNNSQPVYEFNQFLVKVLNPARPVRQPFDTAAAVHDPCHAKYKNKSTDDCRRIIEIIPGIKLVEIPGGSTCCGGGGTFFLRHRALGRDILRKNTSKIKSSGARLVTTTCPACNIRISSALTPESGIPVFHTSQLLFESYGLPGRKKYKDQHEQG